MPLIVFQTRRMRNTLKAPASLGVDLLVLLVAAAVAGALFSFGKQVTAPYQQKTEISLSFWTLPKYTAFSLARGVAAYGLSLIFTLVYGTIAAHNRRAERIMVPALDVLQSIPVLGFLPGVVMAMIALFPTREIGLEIACVIMIFTAQAWNMTFSFFGSLRGIPTPLREVCALNRLGAWRIFRLLELPASMIGLVWNSMMSMAGGWFFLTVEEAFSLGPKDFRLPGIGSYMAEAINQGDKQAMLAGVVAMVIMIVAVDQLFWRPVVVWSERFKVEETAEADKPQSWVLNILQNSRLYKWVLSRFDKKRNSLDALSVDAPAASLPQTDRPPLVPLTSKPAWRAVSFIAKWAVLLLLAVGSAWGVWTLVRLLASL